MWKKMKTAWFNLPIGKKHYLIIGGILGMVVLSLMVTTYFFFSVTHTYNKIMKQWMFQWGNSQELKHLIYARINTGLEFVLTENDTYKQQFEKYTEEYDRRIGILEYVVFDNEVYRKKAGLSAEEAGAIKSFYDRHFREHAKEIREFVAISQDWDLLVRNLVLPVSDVGNKEDAKLNLQELEPLTHQLVQSVNRISALMTEKMNQLGQKTVQEARTTMMLQALLAVWVILITLMLSWLLIRSITKPITILHQGTRRLADGDLDYRVPLENKDELGQLGHAFNHMAFQLKELIRELNETNQRLRIEKRKAQEASRLKSEFLATMSHELRTPLNGIIGFADALHNQFFGKLNRKQLEYVSYIRDNGKHLLKLINELLDLSKIEAGKMTLKPEIVEVEPFFKQSLIVVQERAQKQNLTLEFENRATVRTLKFDPLRVRQIMNNLLSNAVKFTPEGGKVGIRLSEDKDFLYVTVWDTGIGIRPERLEKIFEPFYQDDSAYHRRYEGTGLGLALTQKLVSLHGGKLQVESRPGQGSQFTFSLPIRLDEHRYSAGDEPLLSVHEPEESVTYGREIWVIGSRNVRQTAAGLHLPDYRVVWLSLEELAQRWMETDLLPRVILFYYQKGMDIGHLLQQEWVDWYKDHGIPLIAVCPEPLALQEKGSLFRLAAEVWEEEKDLGHKLRQWLDQAEGGGSGEKPGNDSAGGR